MAPEHAVDLCLVSALDGVFLEPSQNVSVEADGDGLLQRTVEFAPASVNPVLRGRLRYVDRVDRFIRQFRKAGQLFDLRRAKRSLPHSVSFHAAFSVLR